MIDAATEVSLFNPLLNKLSSPCPLGSTSGAGAPRRLPTGESLEPERGAGSDPRFCLARVRRSQLQV